MKIEYTYTFEDYEAINTARRNNHKFARIRFFAIWALILANLIIGNVFLWWMVKGDWPVAWNNFANLFIGIGILLAHIFGGPWYRRWYMRQQMVEGKTIHLEADENGIVTYIENTSTKTAWAGVHSVDELKSHFLVWLNKLQAYSIPKRAFDNDEEIDRFRVLLVEKVKNRTF